MSDTAAFFDKKKKKKKSFKKFNANKIDISQVTSTVHVDAPDVSSEAQLPVTSAAPSKNDGAGDTWDESKHASNMAKAPAASANGAAELMDMKALELKRNEEDNIAERMRIEENKAKLAAAREGMEKEAQRLKEEKEAKEAKKQARFDAAPAASSVGGAGKWIPSRVRNPTLSRPSPSGSSRFGAVSVSSGYQRKVDTNDEELFPDLATADKLIQEEEDQKAEAAAKAAALKKAKAAVNKPTPWGSKSNKEAEKPEKKEEEPKPVEKKPEAPAPAPTPAAAPTPSPAPVKKKKKKKKDLSTFKSS